MTARPHYVIALMGSLMALLLSWSTEPRPGEFRGTRVEFKTGWVCNMETDICHKDGIAVSTDRGDKLQ